MTILEKIALAATFYFRQVLKFGRLINKNVLEWFVLLMCKEKYSGQIYKPSKKKQSQLCF